jgi:hypothetical protein
MWTAIIGVIICVYREHKGYTNQDIGLLLSVSLSVFTVNLDSGTLYVHGKHR